MPKPTLMQAILQKPTQRYNSPSDPFYSPATDPIRRRRTQSEYGGGSDTSSIRSFSSFGAASFQSSTSFKRNPGRRYSSSVSAWAASVEHSEPSRKYGNFLAEREPKSLRTKSVDQINAETRALHRRQSSASTTDSSPRQPKTRKKASASHLGQETRATDLTAPAPALPALPDLQPIDASAITTDDGSRVATNADHQLRSMRSLDRVQEEDETAQPPPGAPSFPAPVQSQETRSAPPRTVSLHSTLENASQSTDSALRQHSEPPVPPVADRSFPILSPLVPRDLSSPIILTALDLHVGHRYVIKGAIQSQLPGPSVVVRVTRDGWATHVDLFCAVSPLTPPSHHFETILEGQTGQRVTMAVKMFSGAHEFWEANNGQNFTILLPELLPGATTPPAVIAAPTLPTITHQPPTPLKTDPEGIHPSPRDSIASFYSATSLTEQTENTPSTTPPSSDVSNNRKVDPPPPQIRLVKSESEQKLSHSPDTPQAPPRPAKSPDRPTELHTPEPVGMVRSPSTTALSSDRPTPLPAAVPYYPSTMVVPSAPPRVPATTIKQQMAIAEFEQSREFAYPVSQPPPRTASITSRTSSSTRGRAPASNIHEPFYLPKVPSSSNPAPSSAPLINKDTEPVASLGQLYAPADFEGASQMSRTRSSETHLDLPRTAPSISASSSTSRRSSSSIHQGYRSRTVRPTKTKSVWTDDLIANASTTMCAIAMARNAIIPAARSKLMGKRHEELAQRPRSWADIMFTDRAEPPKKIKATEVLVQVFSVGLDFWDAARVDLLVRRGDGYGFVPGRSFVGRVLQTGPDVKLKVGDLVYGLNDLAKSGALAELLVVDRQYVALAPNGFLSLEELALAPLAGVPALAAVSTICEGVDKGARILILNGQAGAGYVATQLFHLLRPENDLYVAIQVPENTMGAESNMKANGAADVFRDEPMVAINRIHESSFDVILDTIGGRRIYDASRRILRDGGYFISLVGDDLGPPSARKSWQSGLRSLRRAFVKKDRKVVNYWLPMLTERDHRESLTRLREFIEQKSLKPVVRRVWRFEHGAEAFQGHPLYGGTVVLVKE